MFQLVKMLYARCLTRTGKPRWRWCEQVEVVYRVLFPAAKSGLLAACMLGVGRAVGETMAVWMASGSTENIPDNLFNPVASR